MSESHPPADLTKAQWESLRKQGYKHCWRCDGTGKTPNRVTQPSDHPWTGGKYTSYEGMKTCPGCNGRGYR